MPLATSLPSPRRRPPTACRGRSTPIATALDQAAIAGIGAHSAPAKGRVERTWGTLQDRLVVELRLEAITTIDDANAFLPHFLVRYNERFRVPAREPEPAWRPWPDGLDAASVFCFHYPRRVARDATISWSGGPLALPRRADGRSWAGRSVVLQERLDGSLWVSHDGLCLPVVAAPADPRTLRARDLSRSAEGGEDHDPGVLPSPRSPSSTSRSVPARPGPDHPWRRGYAARGR